PPQHVKRTHDATRLPSDARCALPAESCVWYVACMLRTRGWEIAAAACLFVACAKEQSTVDAAADGTLLTPYLAIGDTLAHDRTDDLAALGALAIEAANRE